MDIYQFVDVLGDCLVMLVFYIGNFFFFFVNNGIGGMKIDLIVVELCNWFVFWGYIVVVVDYCKGWNLIDFFQDFCKFFLINVVYCGVQDVCIVVCFMRKLVVDGDDQGNVNFY